MSTTDRAQIDALLKEELNIRAAGPHDSAELLHDVLLAVRSTTQGASWAIAQPSIGRPLAVLMVGALLLAAFVGFTVMAGSRLAKPAIPRGTGDIAFVQASYSWNGIKDWNGEPIPTVEDERIVSLNSAGGEPTVVADVPGSVRQTLVGGAVAGPVVRWSPDGSRIAFRLLLDAPGIYAMNRNGSEMTRLTDLSEPLWQRDWGEPTPEKFAWSPDGTRIAFTSPLGADGPGGLKLSSVYIVDTSDGRLLNLIGPNATGGAFPPIAWSPDGSRIAFARSRGPLRDSTNGLVVMNADGSGETLLVEIHDVDLGPFAWAPDGSQIAFMRGSTSEGKEAEESGLWVANPDGTDARRINAEPWSTEVQAVHDMPFGWSPDGRWIARLGGPANDKITLVASDGSGERVIGGRGPGNDGVTDFAWSPDGSQLVFSDSGGAITENPPTWDPPSIYVINVDGTGERWIADGEYPDWAR